ncbi:hypothetical protein BZA05DRAFT_457297 [Tricharina praecox]|uniref:uncharacterized protein n=1 Tax=Tricharina praecox TaxID=43433 RepID=UPI0022209C29|nr:uncharacterized protein BZA05DRAFT_457297 [Tricharina praecox]KAI5848100.1 hypothetical protein BZA05DRAFT_457297 [Tricharina praecox]
MAGVECKHTRLFWVWLVWSVVGRSSVVVGRRPFPVRHPTCVDACGVLVLVSPIIKSILWVWGTKAKAVGDSFSLLSGLREKPSPAQHSSAQLGDARSLISVATLSALGTGSLPG